MSFSSSPSSKPESQTPLTPPAIISRWMQNHYQSDTRKLKVSQPVEGTVTANDRPTFLWELGLGKVELFLRKRDLHAYTRHLESISLWVVYVASLPGIFESFFLSRAMNYCTKLSPASWRTEVIHFL